MISYHDFALIGHAWWRSIFRRWHAILDLYEKKRENTFLRFTSTRLTWKSNAKYRSIESSPGGLAKRFRDDSVSCARLSRRRGLWKFAVNHSFSSSLRWYRFSDHHRGTRVLERIVDDIHITVRDTLVWWQQILNTLFYNYFIKLLRWASSKEGLQPSSLAAENINFWNPFSIHMFVGRKC